jgi:ribosomal protein S18 acetylase RimI-like enzyme
LADPLNRQKPRFRFEPLDKKKHDRAAFSCEHEPLNKYLREQASQEIKKRVAAVYVLTPDGKTIAGYYTLSQYAIDAEDLPPEDALKLRIPKYDKLPATLLGRLARSQEFKGMGIGEMLLAGALKRALEHSRHIASLAVVVDAKDDRAAAFYRSYGFIDLPNHPKRLFIPMRSIGQVFAETGSDVSEP